jgi:phosphoribosylamine--glycine ligase
MARTKKVGRFLILSDAGDGVGLAVRLKAEGHDVKVKIFDPSHDEQGKGLIEPALEYKSGQTVIADVTGFGHILEEFRDGGTKVFGGSVFADKLETDRGLAEEVMNDAGIETPEAVNVTSWSDAAEACERLGSDGGKVVIKPEGGLSGVVPSYVASDVEDAHSMLKVFEKEQGSAEVEITVQEFVEGVAVSTEGWFNGKEWAEGMFNHTIERKHSMNGDLGPSGGCTGNVIWRCDISDPIVKQTLIKLTKVLQKHNYVGIIDINCIVNEEGIYGLEFTPRFGYDSFPTTLHSLCDFNFGAFLDTMARGDTPTDTLSEGFGVGVRLSLPPWPSEKYHAQAGVSIRGFKEDDKQWFYPYGVMLVDGELQSSHGVGILGVVNGHGDSIGEGFARAYEIVTRLRIPEVQYRTDLAQVCLKDYRELRRILTDGDEGWIGVDLDGTLATYSKWSDDIGEPIDPMVSKVKRWISEGKEVRVFTARGSQSEGKYEQLIKIYDWIKEHIGEPLEVTHEKDPQMLRLYDDRVRQVEANEGVLV